MSQTPSSYRLMNAAAALREAAAAMIAADPELADDDVRLADMLGSDPDTCETMELLHRIARAALHAQDLALVAASRADAIYERRKRFEARAERLRAAMLIALQTLDLKRVELADMTLSQRAGRIGIEITDEDAVPDAFKKITSTVSKTLIGEAMERGEDVPGAARRNGAPSLTIRTR